METEVVDTDYLLTTEDRCDTCGVQAYVYVIFESGDLLFCLHHWNTYKDVVTPLVSEILDESNRLLAR